VRVQLEHTTDKRSFRNRGVAGSNPARPTNCSGISSSCGVKQLPHQVPNSACILELGEAELPGYPYELEICLFNN